MYTILNLLMVKKYHLSNIYLDEELIYSLIYRLMSVLKTDLVNYKQKKITVILKKNVNIYNY